MPPEHIQTVGDAVPNSSPRKSAKDANLCEDGLSSTGLGLESRPSCCGLKPHGKNILQGVFPRPQITNSMSPDIRPVKIAAPVPGKANFQTRDAFDPDSVHERPRWPSASTISFFILLPAADQSAGGMPIGPPKENLVKRLTYRTALCSESGIGASNHYESLNHFARKKGPAAVFSPFGSGHADQFGVGANSLRHGLKGPNHAVRDRCCHGRARIGRCGW